MESAASPMRASIFSMSLSHQSRLKAVLRLRAFLPLKVREIMFGI